MTKTIIPGYNGFVEWRPEVTFGDCRAGTFPTDADPTVNETLSWAGAAMWPGLVQSFKINDTPIVSSTRYLKAHNETMRSTSVMHSKTGAEIKVDFEYAPQPIDGQGLAASAFLMFGYSITKTSTVMDGTKKDAVNNDIEAITDAGITGKAFVVGETVASIGFSTGIEGTSDYYMVYWGCVPESITLSFAQDENAKLNFSYVGAGSNGPTVTDVIGAANHVDESVLVSPISYDGVCNMRIRGRDPCSNSWTGINWIEMDPTRSVEIKVTNNLHFVKDIGCKQILKQTKIVDVIVLSRDITVALEIDYNNFELFTNVKNFWYYQLVFDVKYDNCAVATSKRQCRFCFDGVRFSEMPIELNPENVIGETITSMPVNGFSMHDVDYGTPAITIV